MATEVLPKCCGALVRAAPSSLLDQGLCLDNSRPKVNCQNAIAQHKYYKEVLAKKANIRLFEAPLDNNHPDSVFVEDLCIQLQSSLLLCWPGAPSRIGERESIRSTVLEIAKQLGLHYLEQPEGCGILDGGNVLQVRSHSFVFVGVGMGRTDQQAVDWLQSNFSGLKVIPVPLAELGEGVLHLKSVCTFDEFHNCIILSSHATSLTSMFEKYDLQVKVTPDLPLHLQNHLSINDSIVCQPGSEELFSRNGCTVYTVDMSEFAKVDGCLTCCSVLLWK